MGPREELSVKLLWPLVWIFLLHTSPFSELSPVGLATLTSMMWLTNHHPSVLRRCWLGHLTRKIVPEMTYNVSTGTLNSTRPVLIYCCVWLAVDLSLAVPVTNALTLVFTAIAGRLIGEDVGLSMCFTWSLHSYSQLQYYMMALLSRLLGKWPAQIVT